MREVMRTLVAVNFMTLHDKRRRYSSKRKSNDFFFTPVRVPGFA